LDFQPLTHREAGPGDYADALSRALCRYLYWKRATTAGIIASMVGGVASTLLWYVFVYQKTATAITGIKVAAPLGLLDPLFIGIPVSFALVIIVSLVTKKPSEEHIARAFTGIS
jgi:SSS family solute:Na+ symporter